MFRNIAMHASFFFLASIIAFTSPGCGNSKTRSSIPVITETPLQPSGLANTNGKPSNSVPDPGEVDGTVEAFTVAGGDLENSFLNQPAPYVFLTFASKNETVEKVELPDEAKKLVNDFWKTALNYRLKTEVYRTKTAQEEVDLGMALFQAAERSSQGFQKVEVKTPTGKRVISHEEARGLISFISQAAMTVTEQAKKQKGN